MILRFFTLAVVFLLSCSEFERGNPFDGEGINYNYEFYLDDEKEEYQCEDPYAEAIEYKFTDPRDKKIYDVVEFKVTMKSDSKYDNFNIAWMAQNLNYDAPGSVCYNKDETKCATYGRLYDFETAKTACPSGWRLPITGEEKLVTCYYYNTTYHGFSKTSLSNYIVDYAFGYNSCYNDNGHCERWVLGGLGYSNSKFRDINSVGYWWTSSIEGKTGKAYSIFATKHHDKYGDYALSGKGLNDKSSFLSVRCVQD
jgi:uncharacterized protein (TIGR02145 family)